MAHKHRRRRARHNPDILGLSTPVLLTGAAVLIGGIWYFFIRKPEAAAAAPPAQGQGAIGGTTQTTQLPPGNTSTPPGTSASSIPQATLDAMIAELASARARATNTSLSQAERDAAAQLSVDITGKLHSVNITA